LKPTRLLLKAFRGIKDGLGLDTYELDLEAFGDARLVAIAGPNGKGKSTVLDNLHPYPILPSRAPNYSLGAFSMYDHVLAPEAVKELDWEHQGKKYRSSLLWRNSGKRKSCEAYLFEADQGLDWKPATLPDGTVSDGKIEIYNRMLVEILGTPEMFFSSQFSAQGRRKLFEYKEGELKQLLVELLNLRAISDLGTTAQQVLRGLASAADALRIAATPPRDAPNQETLAVLIADAEVRAKTLADAKRIEQTALLSAQQALANARAQSGRRQQLSAEFASIENAMRDAEATFHSQRNLRLATIRTREELLLRREAVLAAPAELERLNAEIARDQERLRTARQKREEQLKAQADLAAAESDLRAKREAFANANHTLAQIAVRARLAHEVPCVGSDLQPRCKLLKEALEAAARIPESETLLKSLSGDGTTLAAKREEIDKRVRAAGEPTKDCLDIEATLERSRKAKGDCERLTALLPSIEAARGELDATRKELALLDADHVKTAEERNARKMELAALLAPLDQEERVAQASCDTQGAKTRAAERDLAEVETHLATLKAQALAAKEAERQRAAVHQRCEALRAEQSYWQLLAKALGKDGLIAMLIDEAGPTLAAIANDILLACYGRRFTVSIATQRKLANGDMAETFDILVHDAESDEAKSLAVMSGGQKVWINEALTRAIALYMAQGNERRYQTLFCDESDGPLDPERKLMFVQMQRKVLELGGYNRAFFITQSPELLAYADRVIELT
jgi:exonuclease SbcC